MVTINAGNAWSTRQPPWISSQLQALLPTALDFAAGRMTTPTVQRAGLSTVATFQLLPPFVGNTGEPPADQLYAAMIAQMGQPGSPIKSHILFQPLQASSVTSLAVAPPVPSLSPAAVTFTLPYTLPQPRVMLSTPVTLSTTPNSAPLVVSAVQLNLLQAPYSISPLSLAGLPPLPVTLTYPATLQFSVVCNTGALPAMPTFPAFGVVTIAHSAGLTAATLPVQMVIQGACAETGKGGGGAARGGGGGGGARGRGERAAGGYAGDAGVSCARRVRACTGRVSCARQGRASTRRVDHACRESVRPPAAWAVRVEHVHTGREDVHVAGAHPPPGWASRREGVHPPPARIVRVEGVHPPALCAFRREGVHPLLARVLDCMLVSPSLHPPPPSHNYTRRRHPDGRRRRRRR
jgi:hypothetical protein